MAYQIKSIRYRETPRKILLQNENGPCPLLAAANVLLLRGAVSLPPRCLRSGAATVDDVVNMLADRAVSRHAPDADVDADLSESRSPHREYQLNEALSLLPRLQCGMDVNPKFDAGPAGMEYTRNLAALDSLGIELVHGWLVDPQDVETCAAVGNRSYNELIELVIGGKEAGERVEQWRELIERKERCLEAWNQGETVEAASAEAKPCNDADDAEAALSSSSTNENNDPAADDPQNHENDGPTTNSPPANEQKSALQNEIADLRSKISSESKLLFRSQIIHDFLTTTGHQLTYHGLERLHDHLSEDALCVFFRNNHFAALTKHDGTLYLLVTDLGYAHAPEIVWEKLDVIDGDTEYANEFFCRPKHREESTARPESAGTETASERHRVDLDREVALAWQREEERMEHESEQLARQLQELEYSRQRARGARPASAASSSKNAASSSTCVVS